MLESTRPTQLQWKLAAFTGGRQNESVKSYSEIVEEMRMSFENRKFRRSSLALAVAAAIGMAAAPSANAYESPLHVFSINDIQGGFDGSTYGPDGAFQDTSIICGVPGGYACPEMRWPVRPDKEGVMLYPIDSQFGFYVVDFVGAQEKDYDGDYLEGWAGNITDGDTVIGVKISNAETDRYKVKAPLGTWCQGLGGNSVKCSTEHYTVLEHVLSCHETIPYFYADPVSGDQGIQETPDGSLSVDCGDAGIDLDDNLLIISSDASLGRDPTHRLDAGRPDRCQRQHLGAGRPRRKRRLLRDPQGRRQGAVPLGRPDQAAERHPHVRPPGAAG